MNEKNDFALVPRPTTAVEKAEPGAKRILSGMVADTLALARDAALDALVLEGRRIQRRQGMTPEDIQAFDLFHRAAVAGHGQAQLLVYECYLFGHGVREDLAKASEWFHKSAESGFADAQCQLADFYYYGQEGGFFQQDYVRAAQWYRKAAEQGHAHAQCNLGLCFSKGEGVRQDYAEAAKWTREAAEQGNVAAQENLAVAYDRGHGVPQDYAEAARWHQEAAEQGNAGAQNNLGACYAAGQGVPQDCNEALKWLRKAAGQGLAEAQYSLARCYENIMLSFEDFLARHAPLIGDCSLLPYPKKTIHYAIATVMDDYETKREDTTNQTLREECQKVIPTLRYLLTRLVNDWQEIEQEDKAAIAKLGCLDSFPDWALPLKLKYLDEERASIEAVEMKLQVLKDKIEREKHGVVDTGER